MDSEISPGDLRNNRLKQRGSKATFHKLSLNGELVMAQSKSTIGNQTLSVESHRLNDVDNSPGNVRKTIDGSVIKL